MPHLCHAWSVRHGSRCVRASKSLTSIAGQEQHCECYIVLATILREYRALGSGVRSSEVGERSGRPVDERILVNHTVGRVADDVRLGIEPGDHRRKEARVIAAADPPACVRGCGHAHDLHELVEDNRRAHKAKWK